MTRWRLSSIATRVVVALFGAALITAAVTPSGAAAAEWQASRIFSLDPAEIPGPPGEATKAVYRLLDSEGNPVAPTMAMPVTELLDWIEVPPAPAIYTLEATLEDAAGKVVRRTTTDLHFDDAAPSPPTPASPDRWLLADEPAVLTIGHPEAPLPLSGIRGYAVSLDRGGGGSPCAAELCSAAELDLPGGIGDDSLTLGTLPEGTTVARVAAVSGSGVSSEVRTAVFKVDGAPPSVSLQGLPSGWSDGPVQLTALAADPLSGMAAAGPRGPFTAIAVDGGPWSIRPGDTATAWVSGSGVHAVEFYGRDAAGNVADGVGDAPSPASAIVHIDEGPPQVAFAPAQDPAEPERIEASVADSLSGPSPGRGSIAVRPAGAGTRFEELPTSVQGGKLIAHWDSDAYPPGRYEFRATGFDLAGNAATGTDRARGGRMVLLNPLKTPVTLAVRLSGARFTGRLRHLGGGPVVGQEVAVTETFAIGAEPQQRITSVRTGEDGTFSLRLGPGPSRDVVARFGGSRVMTKAASSTIHFSAATAVWLRASTATARVGGKPIVFRGRVRAVGARRAVRGLPVELQFRYPGAGWREFRTVETDSRGRFRYAYRFSDDDSRGVRFRFRAYVKGREGWPYEPGASRPISVTGR